MNIDAKGHAVVPVIDLTPSLTSDLAARKAVATKLRIACMEYGMFIVTGHGIPERIYEGVLEQAKRYYRLPIHIRQEIYDRLLGPYNVGANVSVNDQTKQSFSWKYESRLDDDTAQAEGKGRIVAPFNGWPQEEDAPGFFDSVKAYYNEAFRLSQHMWKLLALSLDLPELYFLKYTTLRGTMGRILFYPALEPSKLGEGELQLGAHTDNQCFTINHPSCQGLEVLLPTGEWAEVPVVDGGLGINVGETLTRWTNGLYKSGWHRVFQRTPEPRYSIPIFNSVDYDTVIEAQQPPITAGDFYRERARAVYEEDLKRSGRNMNVESMMELVKVLTS
ncbi:hypothetical protein SLS56_011450 [Neofusicoccum ribis]|uniref:Fe2OG dioxygenase domain-containing protein n=1 Tax=Neofusicoccum ribis TaxID=45134 RepID=A0ABR3SBK9_9PEZI